ncbi:glycosyltransferase family 9 protein [Paraburkholderia sp. SIMBA_054]|uniref:glycosyltransferase family 9 protein n=1 Tax=Paraburkholderia sp. SIMBA_054 TaxID=3085795 RepID=UPI003978E7C4
MKSLSLVPPPVTAHARVAASAPLTRWDSDIKRILCVRTDNLGDVLMTTPALQALRGACPDRHLTLLTSPAGAAVAPFLADVDEVIRYDAPWAGARPPRSHPADLAMQQRLEEGQFDAAVIFTVYSQNPMPAATMCYLAGIHRRLARCRENPYALLSDWVRETEPEHGVQHEVRRQLSLVQAIGADAVDTRMRMQLRSIDRKTLDSILARRGIDSDAPYAVMHPGASAESRRYPVGQFAQTAARLVRATGMNVLVTGSKSEAALAHTLIDAAGPSVRPFMHDLTDAFELGAFAALIERAAVVISNNSGPVHIASALGAPVVDLYALTNPQHGPWQTPHRVLFNDVECRWCYRSVCPEKHHACLRGISPADVADAALALIDETGGTPVSARPAGHSIATHTE